MNVMPTINGGLKLTPENAKDWNVLRAIAIDAHEELASRLGGLMDEEAMWEDIVVPDLKTYFSGQLKLVLDTVNAAQEEGEVLISKEDAEMWYGALNQARLGLESKYRFGPEEQMEPESFTTPEEQSAYLRGRFYFTIQSLLLDYVMDE